MFFSNLSKLFKNSSVPGLSHLFTARTFIRKTIWIIVICIFTYLTSHSLIEIISEYFHFPITVNVLISESRVLNFPAITVCNLNPVSKSRFCNENVTKPEHIKKILCASLDSLMEVCNVYKLLNDLVGEGEKICKGLENRYTNKKLIPSSRNKTRPISNNLHIQRPAKIKPKIKQKLNSTLFKSQSFLTNQTDEYVFENCLDHMFNLDDDLEDSESIVINKNFKRIKRQINFRNIFRFVRAFTSGKFESFSEIFSIFGISEESEAFFDNLIVQLARLAKININSTQDLIPALFLKSFSDSTGCQIGVSSTSSTNPNKIQSTLRNLTRAFVHPRCFLKLPRLFELFSKQFRNLMESISNCTSSWVLNLLKEEFADKNIDTFDLNTMRKTMESSWNVLLDILKIWIAELGKNNLNEAIRIGHRKTDLISSCHFAGRKCDIEKDFTSFFFTQYGNCYTYNLHLPKKEKFESSMQELYQEKEFHENGEEYLSGFTGPQFGLELILNLETTEYMPTTREIGAKIMIHDSKKRADPEEDSTQIQPGVVTYIGIQMINVSREKAPYTDKCSDDWPTKEQFEWAKSLNHDGYTTQLCLKLCLQYHTIKKCGCWMLASPWPQENDIPICNTRKNMTIRKCTSNVRKDYYNEKISCQCPPRCSEEIYEKFVSTGKETRKCTALSTNDEEKEENSFDEEDNYAKVIIFYQSLTFNTIKQSPKYTTESLIGAVGGILGVYLGLSFLAIYEFIEVLLRSSLLICFKNLKNKNQVNTSNQSNINDLSSLYKIDSQVQHSGEINLPFKQTFTKQAANKQNLIKSTTKHNQIYSDEL